MQVTVEIPDEMAQRLIPEGGDPARTTLQAIATEGYRSDALSSYQTRILFGPETRYEPDGFLKAHNVWEHAYSLDDLDQDRLTIKAVRTQALWYPPGDIVER